MEKLVVQPVRLADIVIPSFERPLDEKRVNKISRQFNPLFVRRPLLNKRNGKFYLMDGQHTRQVLLTKGYEYWDCDVAEVTESEEIFRYVDQYNETKKVGNLDRLYAEEVGYHAEGGSAIPEFVRAHQILNALKNAGWTFERGVTSPCLSKKRNQEQMTITTSTGVEEVYDLAPQGEGEQAVKNTLRTLFRCWPGEPAATAPNTIRAMGKLLRVYGPLSDEQISKLSYQLIDGDGGITTIAKGMGGQNNKRDLIADRMRRVLDLTPKSEFRANGATK